MGNHVLILHSGNVNDNLFVNAMQRELLPMGLRVISQAVPGWQNHITMENSKLKSTIDWLLMAPNDFRCIISFSVYGLSLRIGGVPLCDKVDTPFLVLLFDHPASHFNLQTRFLPDFLDRVTVILCDASQGEYWKTFITSKTTLESFGFLRLTSDEPVTEEHFFQRDVPALVPVNLSAGGQTLDALADEIFKLEPKYSRLVWDSIEASVGDLDHSPCAHLIELVLESGVTLSALSAGSLANYVQAYVKLWRRHKVLQSIIDLPVVFAGQGYPEFVKFGRRARFLEVSMPAIFDVYRRSQIVINVCPGFPNSIHERITCGLSLGAAVASTETPCIRKYWPKEELIAFDFSERKVVDRLSEYITNPRMCFDMMCRARGFETNAERKSRLPTWGFLAEL